MRLPVDSRHLTRRTFAGGTWKPRIAPFGDSRLQGLPMVVRAQERGESECPAVMDGIRVATSPDAKAGRLPHGLSSPESFQNHLNGGKANERCNTGACAFWHDV